MLLALPAAAQTYDNGLVVESVDPAGDAAVIARMRKHMDDIHSTQKRPTVGLVLSGGGAKGSAHVGVLRYLKEQEIPVDMICGTSMGGLVGGLAALGYSPEFMDSLLRAQDWGVMLTDRIDPSYYSYARKKARETYNVSVPFYYSSSDLGTMEDDEDMSYVTAGMPGQGHGPNGFMRSLPSGYVYGFNVNNLLSSLSVGYQGDIDFDTLPIPFFCIAADMVSCKTKIWSSGSLKTAMRSTMSIPGMFKPVKTKGMVLVDGGVRNNFPVDLAKAMGCDIVIGVDLSDQDLTYSEVNNLVDIVMQFVTMLGKSSFDRNKDETDVFIKPVLTGYNMLSFDPVAIDTMIHRGYVAARGKAEELAAIKDLMKGSVPYLNNKEAVDIRTTPVRIASVQFNGLTASESRQLRRKIGFKDGEYVTKDEMHRMMSIIEATGCFSAVNYSIEGTEEPYRLEFHCDRGPRHHFGMGVRFDTEEWPSFLFNIGLNAFKLSAAKFDIDAKVGRNQKLSARAALDLSWMPTLNAEFRLSNVSSTLYTSLHSVGQEARYWGHSERLYLSNIRWTKVDLQMGAQNRFYRLSAKSAYGADFQGRYPDLQKGNYLGLFMRGTLFTQDRFHYPSKGVKMTFGYDYDFIKSGCDSFNPLHTGFFNLNSVIPIGRFSLVPDLHLRALVGSPELDVFTQTPDPGYSLAHQTYVGGMLADRCMEGQIPFIGFGNVYKAGPYTAVMNLGLRLEVVDNLFLTATGGYFREANSIASFIETPLPTLWGAGFEIAYRTMAGPIKVAATWSDRMHNFNQDFGIYISLGFDF